MLSDKGWLWPVLGIALVLAFWRFFVILAVIIIIAFIAYGIGLATAKDDEDPGIDEVQSPPMITPQNNIDPYHHYNDPLYPQGIPFDREQREQRWNNPCQ